MRAAANPPAQLVQLRQPEPLGVLDEHHGRVRHVHADLDDGGRDEDVTLAARECPHDAVLLVRLHPPVQQGDAQVREDVVREMVGHLGGGAQVDFLGLLDQRVDDIHLPAGVHLLSDERVNLLSARLGLRDRLDRKASRRHLPHDRDVEIAVGRERERARDGRRGHDQHVRVHPFRSERGPLEDAEPMLLVDDDEPELVEPDRVLDERMRADHHVNRSAQ